MNWTDAEPILRGQMNAHLDSQPESLFDGDGGPVGKTADVVLARLIGFDDQIIDDRLRLDRVRPEWLAPIMERLTFATAEAAEPLRPPPIRAARYVLQSGYASMQIDPSSIPPPPGVTPGPPDFLYSVLFVRYRRRI